ncbi:TetR/AcrR family transcriptional regulator [Nocardia wallacei]|uniref:TetR/AcrR family transcriptional regulator n=1 Tax=Nocardia wallacei TaxID=480035 RepID=UPI0024563953|nr:TetR/AcrR family transcriptional regulator [Nocardia wallacei]
MSKPKQAVGRPRDSQVDHAIASAARELVAERGYAGFTVDAVAARARVGKAAIYRRYATKQELIYSVLVRATRTPLVPDTGSLAGDLAAVCEAFGTRFDGLPPDVLNGLLADIYADPSLGDRFADTFLASERFVVTEVLDRAVAAGDLSRRPDPGMVQALLLGPIFAWLLILDGEPAMVPDLGRMAAEAASIALVNKLP